MIQLISQFIFESLGVHPHPRELFTENSDPEGYFSSGIIPHAFDHLEDTLKVLNANLVFYQCLSQICQHVSYDLEMLLYPGRYEREWRLIISLMLDFHQYRTEYEERHYELVGEIQ